MDEFSISFYLINFTVLAVCEPQWIDVFQLRGIVFAQKTGVKRVMIIYWFSTWGRFCDPGALFGFLNWGVYLVEENNRMVKTIDLFKKTRNTKGTFHAKMGTIKGKNSKDLTEGEILRRGSKNTQKNCTKKVLMTWITTMVWSLT